MANVRIVTVGILTKVFIDDKEIDGVRKISFSQEPGEIPTLKLDLLADLMVIDSPVLLALPEVYRGRYEHKKIATKVEPVEIIQLYPQVTHSAAPAGTETAE